FVSLTRAPRCEGTFGISKASRDRYSKNVVSVARTAIPSANATSPATQPISLEASIGYASFPTRAPARHRCRLPHRPRVAKVGYRVPSYLAPEKVPENGISHTSLWHSCLIGRHSGTHVRSRNIRRRHLPAWLPSASIPAVCQTVIIWIRSR